MKWVLAPTPAGTRYEPCNMHTAARIGTYQREITHMARTCRETSPQDHISAMVLLEGIAGSGDEAICQASEHGDPQPVL